MIEIGTGLYFDKQPKFTTATDDLRYVATCLMCFCKLVELCVYRSVL